MYLEFKGMRVNPLELADATFVKSTKSGPNTDNCVEVAQVGEAIAVRDSKNPGGTALLFTQDEWTAFREGVAGGEFNFS